MFQLTLVLTGVYLVAAQSSGLYTLSSTVPWTPAPPTTVDQSQIFGNTYYLSNLNYGVQVVDLTTSSLITTIPGFSSGPNGLIILPAQQELYAGDGAGLVQVIDLSTNTNVATIATNTTEPADNFGYDSSTNIMVVVTNANMNGSAYVSVIDPSTRTFLGRVIFEGIDQLAQPTWNPADGNFYISIPTSASYPGGAIAQLELTDPSNPAIARYIPTPQCNPAGIVFGQTNLLFVACGASQYANFGDQFSYILDVTTGVLVHRIADVSGSDQVAYSSMTNYFYASAYKHVTSAGAPDPRLFIVGINGVIAQSIVTDATIAHSLAVQDGTGTLVVPVGTDGIRIYKLGGLNATSTNSSSSSMPTFSSSSSVVVANTTTSMLPTTTSSSSSSPAPTSSSSMVQSSSTQSSTLPMSTESPAPILLSTMQSSIPHTSSSVSMSSVSTSSTSTSIHSSTSQLPQPSSTIPSPTNSTSGNATYTNPHIIPSFTGEAARHSVMATMNASIFLLIITWMIDVLRKSEF